MKFTISLENDHLLNIMRKYGYAPDGRDEKTGELRFVKSLTGRRYPRFHLYATADAKEAALNLHLDQKQPSYQGSSAHSGEYSGLLVENEAQRILNRVKAESGKQKTPQQVSFAPLFSHKYSDNELGGCQDEV